MGLFKRHYPLGLGTSRFPISSPKDFPNIRDSVELVFSALEAGVNYIDVGYT